MMRGGLRRRCRRAGGLGPRTCTSIGHVVAMRCVIPFASMLERIIMWRAAVKEEYPQATRRSNNVGGAGQALIVYFGVFSTGRGTDGLLEPVCDCIANCKVHLFICTLPPCRDFSPPAPEDAGKRRYASYMRTPALPRHSLTHKAYPCCCIGDNTPAFSEATTKHHRPSHVTHRRVRANF